MTNSTIATNEYRGGGNAERTEYHPCVAWDRLAEICGQFLSKGQLVDVDGRVQSRQWDDDAGKRHWAPRLMAFFLYGSNAHSVHTTASSDESCGVRRS